MHPIIIQEQDALRGDVSKRVVLIVGVDRDIGTSVQHSTILCESLSDGKEIELA
jgi:hypothetical protein